MLRRILYEDKIVMKSFIPWLGVALPKAGSSTIINSEFMVTRNDSTNDSTKIENSPSFDIDIKRPNLLAIPEINISGSSRAKATRSGNSGLDYLDLSRM